MDTREIIVRCKRNDRRGQRQLYERYAAYMFKVCYRYVQDPLDAEDLVIGGFLKVYNNLARFEYRDEPGLVGWIKKIVVNEALMYLRRRSTFHMVPADDAASVETDLSPADRLSAEDLYKLIGGLPTGYRTVFNLHLVEGYSHKEIAQQLGISENTSKSQLSKAKAMLRKLIDKMDIRYGT